MNKLLNALFFGFALLAPAAHATTLTYSDTWAGATVSMSYPDKVIYQTAFDWSFTVDSSTMTDFGQIAFLSEVAISDTVDLSQATWTYQSSSLDPFWNFTETGSLGDAFTSLTTTGSGYKIAFSDPNPYTGPYSWLTASYEDKITWTLSNIIIQGDTAFSLTLDDGGILDGGSQHNIIVIDPPAPTAVAFAPAAIPEPSTYALTLAGLGLLVAFGRRRAPAPAAAS